MAAMLDDSNSTISLLWEMKSILMQTFFIVAAINHNSSPDFMPITNKQANKQTNKQTNKIRKCRTEDYLRPTVNIQWNASPCLN